MNIRSPINPTGMTLTIEFVTPSDASRYIATMPLDEQRNFRPTRVRAYAEAIRNNAFSLHHQGIAFDTEGVMRDGQHRCRAIVEAGIAVPMVVARNVPRESFIHVDEGLPRSIQDAIKMAGKGNYSSSIVCVARVFFCYPQSEPTDMADRNHLLAVLRTIAEPLAFAEENCMHRSGLTRSVRVLVGRAYLCNASHSRLKEWCEVLRTGMPQNPVQDSAAIVYRNFLMSRKSAGHGVEVEKYRKGQTALSAFLKGEPMTKVYGTEMDVFPVPDRILEELNMAS